MSFDVRFDHEFSGYDPSSLKDSTFYLNLNKLK